MTRYEPRFPRWTNGRGLPVEARRAVLVMLMAWWCGPAAAASYRDAAVAQQAVAEIADTVMVRAMASKPGASSREQYFVFFRFEGLFWSYAPELGTRVCGAAPDQWPPSGALVTGWIHQVDPSLSSISIYRGAQTPLTSQADLPNGCVIACLAQISRLLVNAGTPDEAGLVLFSYDRPQKGAEPDVGIIDHSILVYRYHENWFCLDPRLQEAPLPLKQVAVGLHLDPTLRVLAERPAYRLEHARLLLIASRTLDHLAAKIALRLWNQRPD
ncbi:MAG TPA: hypothetical protein VLT83_11925 [Opitutaceae bacterium]|nr:hypothetical protein [Opitutaceae bacterium]